METVSVERLSEQFVRSECIRKGSVLTISDDSANHFKGLNENGLFFLLVFFFFLNYVREYPLCNVPLPGFTSIGALVSVTHSLAIPEHF